VPVFRDRQTTRLETFVDAAFAFALTMLVVSVDSVPQSFDGLVDAIKRVPAFAASFLITVMFWLGHYRWSRRYGIEDTGSVVLSLLLVFLMLVFLYPLRLMMSGAFHSVSGGWLPGEIVITRIAHLQFILVLYGVAFLMMSGVLLAMLLPPRQIGYAVWIYASLPVIMPVMKKRRQRQVERAVAAEARSEQQ
jgi:uncharacterized membrane protein